MPDYFRSIGISLKAGRTLNESDTATAEKAVVVNEAFVKDYLADVANPLGQRVYIGKMFGFEQPWRIVGVVSHARQFNLRSAPPASVFVSALQLANAEGKFQSGQRALKFVIRTTGDPLQLGAAVRQAMLEIEPNLPLTRLRSMEQCQRNAFLGCVVDDPNPDQEDLCKPCCKTCVTARDYCSRSLVSP